MCHRMAMASLNAANHLRARQFQKAALRRGVHSQWLFEFVYVTHNFSAPLRQTSSMSRLEV